VLAYLEGCEYITYFRAVFGKSMSQLISRMIMEPSEVGIKTTVSPKRVERNDDEKDFQKSYRAVFTDHVALD
jgi:hypothetical protein